MTHHNVIHADPRQDHPRHLDCHGINKWWDRFQHLANREYGHYGDLDRFHQLVVWGHIGPHPNHSTRPIWHVHTESPPWELRSRLLQWGRHNFRRRDPKQVPATLIFKAVTAIDVANLTWNANTDLDLAGYKAYEGTSSGAYTAPVTTLPKPTIRYTVAGLYAGTTYFFVITACDTAGNESLHSTEVSKSIY